MVRRRVALLMIIGLLAAAVASAQVAMPYIFASGEEVAIGIEGSGYFSQIGVIDLELADSWLLFEAFDYSFEDVVVGPGPASDGGSDPPLYVYACDPTAGLIIRFDPTWVGAAPLGIDDVEIVYSTGPVPDLGPEGSGNFLSPQCGWFTSRGDLIFTDRDGLGAWICEGIGFAQPAAAGTMGDPLCQMLGPVVDNLAPLASFDFWGGGITQAADGDALAIDTSMGDPQGRILRFEIDGPSGTFPDQPPAPLSLVDELGETILLDGPLGIARLSTGDIFVSSDSSIFTPPDAPEAAGKVLRFVGERGDNGDKIWVLRCEVDLTSQQCGDEDVFFLEAAADDTVYVGTSSAECGPAVWAVAADDDGGFSCTAEKIFPAAGGEYGWRPDTLIGLGLSPNGTAPASTGMAPDYFIDFNDHVFELTAPEWCAIETAFAEETPASCLQTIIDEHVAYDGPFEGLPVLYLGDKALGQTYYVEGSCAPDVEGTFRYAVSAYTEELVNPRIIRCDVTPPPIDSLPGADICFPDESDVCDVIDLASFFPGEGVLPEDGRISGTTRTSDFSQFFVVDSGPDGYSGNGMPACSCGFRPPVANVSDPFGLGKSVFREGRSISFKARFTAGACSDGFCTGRDFIAPAGVLLSIARLYDADGNRAFAEIDLDCHGGGCSEEPYFEPPANPTSGFHMNVRTDGWLPGTYIATLTVTNRGLMPGDPEYVAPVFVTYFDIIP